VKTDYENHAIKEHPDSLPEDLQVEPTLSTGDVHTLQDITMISVRNSPSYDHCTYRMSPRDGQGMYISVQLLYLFLRKFNGFVGLWMQNEFLRHIYSKHFQYF